MAVIMLNGCTSAGKTTLAGALQARLDGAWLRMGIDDGFAMLGSRYHNHREGFYFDRDGAGAVRLNVGAVGLATIKAWHRAVAAVAGDGMNVIVDEVMLSAALRDDWIAVLADCDVLMVGVHCPLPELERRERARGDRMVGQARGQYACVHAGVRYDVEVDTGSTAPAACAERIHAALHAEIIGVAMRAMGSGA